MSISIKHLTNLNVLATFVILAFSLVSFLTLTSSMHMENKGSASNCIFMAGEPANCQMTIAQHINSWQGTFLAVVQPGPMMFLFIAMLLTTAILASKYLAENQLILQLFRRYQKENSDFKLFDYLLVAMSRGILQPKLYA